MFSMSETGLVLGGWMWLLRAALLLLLMLVFVFGLSWFMAVLSISSGANRLSFILDLFQLRVVDMTCAALPCIVASHPQLRSMLLRLI